MADMRIRHYIHIFVFLFISAVPSALAKHVAAAMIEPIVHKGVRYVVPNDKGLRAYVEAWDVQTGRKLWTKIVFRHWYVPIPIGRTECLHYEWITSMAVQTDILMPDIANDPGPKFTLRIAPMTEVSLALRTTSEAASAEYLGVQRMELFNGPITDGLSKLFGKQPFGVRTLSFVGIPDGLFMMAEQQGDSETSRSCCFPDIRGIVPEHLQHLIPPEFLEKQPDATGP